MTSSAHDADLKGNNFRHTIHPQSFIAVAFIFSELDGGASGAPPPVQKIKKKPGLDRVKKKMIFGFVGSKWIKLNPGIGHYKLS